MIPWEIAERRACIFTLAVLNLMKFMSLRIVFLYAKHMQQVVMVVYVLGSWRDGLGMVANDSSMVVFRPCNI